jgi:outer membrane protein assembly factor BamB
MRIQFLTAVVAGGLCWSSVAGDWSQWRGSNRDLIVSGENLLTTWPAGGPERLWLADLPGEGYSEPVVVSGTVYITGSTGDKRSRAGHLYALEAKTGKVLWQSEYGPEWGANFEFARTSPTVVAGLVYLIGGQGHVVCLDA